MKIKLPFKTRKQLNLEIAHLTEQLRICSFEREKERSRNNFEETRLECEVMDLKEKLAAHDCDQQTIDNLRTELAEQRDIAAGLTSSLNELKEKNKRYMSKIKTLEAKLPKKEPKTTYKDPSEA